MSAANSQSNRKAWQKIKQHLPVLKPVNCFFALFGSVILAFGLYHVHSFSGVTEGGVLGLTLFFHHWFALSPAISGFIMNALCYLLGWKTLGKEFIGYSAIAGIGFSAFYAIFEQFDPLFPSLPDHPFVAAVVGALFVGIGVGISVRAGGAPGGDDALAMSLSHVLHTKIEVIYLLSDLIVLAMSISYIPLKRIAYSLLTVMISGQIIGWMQKIPLGKKRLKKAAASPESGEAAAGNEPAEGNASEASDPVKPADCKAGASEEQNDSSANGAFSDDRASSDGGVSPADGASVDGKNSGGIRP